MKRSRRELLASSVASAAFATTPLKTAPKADAWMPKLSENLNDVTPSTRRWLKQLGCTTVIFQGTDSVDPDHKGYWNRRRHNARKEELPGSRYGA
jgi:hypothetical protein